MYKSLHPYSPRDECVHKLACMQRRVMNTFFHAPVFCCVQEFIVVSLSATVSLEARLGHDYPSRVVYKRRRVEACPRKYQFQEFHWPVRCLYWCFTSSKSVYIIREISHWKRILLKHANDFTWLSRPWHMCLVQLMGRAFNKWNRLTPCHRLWGVARALGQDSFIIIT